MQQLRRAVDIHRSHTDRRVAKSVLSTLREHSAAASALPQLQRWFQRHKLARNPRSSWQQSLRALQLTGRQADAEASEWTAAGRQCWVVRAVQCRGS